MTTKRIFMTGEAGYHNLGDEGMALASASRLRRYFPDAQIVATGLDPLGAVLRHQAEIVPWPLLPGELTSKYAARLLRKIGQKLGAGEDFLDTVARPFDKIFAEKYRHSGAFRQALQMLEQADFVFDMGHGGLTDVFDPFMLCFLYYLAGRLGKPLFISGQSIGPLWRRRSIRMVRSALQVAHTVGLRDKHVSYDILVNEIGVNPKTTRLIEVGDDTLDLTAEEPNWGIFDDPLRRLLTTGDFFAVQWRDTDYTSKFGATEQLVPLVQAVQHLHKRTSLIPVFVPLSWESAGDVLTAARIQDFIQGAFPFRVVWSALGAPQVKWLLGRAKFGIGLSYHFHVFLLSQGIPTIGPHTNRYYEIKLRGAFAAFNHSATPFVYSPTILTDPAFGESVEVALAWDNKKRAAALDATCTQRLRWHTAFRDFGLDNHLISSLALLAID